MKQGAAWLSSARAGRCWVKSRNERTPCIQLPARNGGDSNWTAYASREEGGEDVTPSWPLRLGLHTCYNGSYKAKQNREVKQNATKLPKLKLKAGTQLHEVAIANNPASARRDEYVPGPRTKHP